MKMLMKDGKRKVLTLSYDDGAMSDIKLMQIMDNYGLKGTFNLNAGMFPDEDHVYTQKFEKLKLSEAKKLYINSGHEVAVHGFTHPFLERLSPTEVIFEITEDRRVLEREFKTVVRGMAYPYATYSDTVIDIAKKCGIVYSRTANATKHFKMPLNWLEWHPTCHHKCEELDDLIKRFVEVPNHYGNIDLFYLWGHSSEFVLGNNWDIIEKFAEYAGGRDNIWYATNIEIYDYVKAYENLQVSYDSKIVHNPSAIDVWFEVDKKEYCVKTGETLEL